MLNIHNWSVGIRKPGSKALDTGGFEGTEQKKWKIFASSLFLWYNIPC